MTFVAPIWQIISAMALAPVQLRGRLGDGDAIVQVIEPAIAPIDMPLFLFGLLSLMLCSGAICVALEVYSERRES